VYGHIKEAMELAEEARLERDAALQRQAAATAQVAALQVRMVMVMMGMSISRSVPVEVRALWWRYMFCCSRVRGSSMSTKKQTSSPMKIGLP
jgi:hypothetical protein